MMKQVLSATNKMIVDCFKTAEAEVQRAIAGELGYLDEEEITTAFRFVLSGVLARASNKGDIASAFQKDLTRILGVLGFKSDNLSEFARAFAKGLVAKVVVVAWHPRNVEKRTGGDFGLVLARPLIGGPDVKTKEPFTTDRLHERGLLVQAKKRQKNGKWPRINKKQRVRLVKAVKFLAILLYDYKNGLKLSEFVWCPCGRSRFSSVEKWLRDDKFPKSKRHTTTELLEDLAYDKIGTSDLENLDQVIRPTDSRILSVVVDWDDDKKQFKARTGTFQRSVLKAIKNVNLKVKTKVRRSQ